MSKTYPAWKSPVITQIGTRSGINDFLPYNPSHHLGPYCQRSEKQPRKYCDRLPWLQMAVPITSQAFYVFF
jgi:hypothetical protein